MSEELKTNEIEKNSGEKSGDTQTPKLNQTSSNKIILDKDEFESLLNRIQVLEEKDQPIKKLKKVEEHFAYLREYDGFYLCEFGKFTTKKIDDVKTMFVTVKLQDLNGKIKEEEVKYIEFFAESGPRKKVRLIKRLREEVVTTQDTVSKTNLNEHKEKNFIGGEVDLDVITYKDEYEVEFLDGSLIGKTVRVSANVLNC